MKKYFIQFPLYPECNLHCDYCLHGHWRKIDGKPEFQWSIGDYLKWRDKCLEPDAEIIIHLSSGEPDFGENLKIVNSLMNNTERERFDILINGTMPVPEEWIENKDRIMSIGATYHRKSITEEQSVGFVSNIILMNEVGLPVHVKELAFNDSMPDILKNKEFWESSGVSFKIQHYRSMRCDTDKIGEMTDEMIWNISEEYMSYDYRSDRCACRRGYEGIILRLDGRVLSCWQDQRVVGDIKTGTYRPGSRIVKHILHDGKPKCRVYFDDETIDRSIGQTVGDFFESNINRRGNIMNNVPISKIEAQAQIHVGLESYLFAAQQRMEDAIVSMQKVVSDLSDVALSQNGLIEKHKKRIEQLEGTSEKAVSGSN